MAKLSDDDLFTLPLTFMGVPYGRPGPNTRAAILGLPFDCGTHPFRVGARSGPDAVRLQSPLIRRFNPTHADFDPLSALDVVDCGNVKLTPGRILDAFARIELATARVMEKGAVPVTIGGDGSITVPVMRAVASRHKNLVALHIDSHTDAYAYDPPTSTTQPPSSRTWRRRGCSMRRHPGTSGFAVPPLRRVWSSARGISATV